MATFVLIHGSFQNASFWCHVVNGLERRGHRAVTPDLPSHGSDRTPLESVTMENYRDAIARVVASHDRPPILVGHSMGSPIASVAEIAPRSVSALVFVAGVLPPSGSSLSDMLREFDPAYLSHAIWASDRRSVRLSSEGARQYFFSECPAELVEPAIAELGWEPIGPYETPLVVTDGRFGSVPKYYVEATRDKVVLPSIQRATLARFRFDGVFSLATGHAPFFSEPESLIACLESVATAHG